MNKDFQKIIQQFNTNLQPLADAMKTIDEQFRPIITTIYEIQKTFALIFAEMSESYRTWIKQNSYLFELLPKLVERAKEWQKAQKQNVIEMAQRGWFPNWFTFDYVPEQDVTDLDELMTMHLNESWDEIVSCIIARCPKRKHILETSFVLHKSRNYIASVPLFIAQADGIFCEEIKTFLFAGDKPKEVLEQLVDSGELQKGFFEDILLEPYKIKTQFSEGVKKSTKQDKTKAPNRNGILHGHRKHLDYGTEKNSLKAFSLLAFVVFSTKDVFKKKSMGGRVEHNRAKRNPTQ